MAEYVFIYIICEVYIDDLLMIYGRTEEEFLSCAKDQDEM